MAGPGNMWALVISAHFAMQIGPEVYCFCTVPYNSRSVWNVHSDAMWRYSASQEGMHTSNIPKFPILKHQESLALRNLSQSSHTPIAEVDDDVCVGL